MTLRDKDIRGPLIEYLSPKGTTTTEYVVEHARADVACLTNEGLVIYEIKSDVDTPARLQRQASAYDKVAHQTYLVTTAGKVDKYLDLVPVWWGILVAHETEAGVEFREYRDARKNLTWQINTAMKLLWNEELDAIADRYKIRGVAGRPKTAKTARVIGALGPELSLAAWRKALDARFRVR